MIDEATVIAAMAAVEAETKDRAISAVRAYAAQKKSQSRIAAAKAQAAEEIAILLEILPVKSH